MKKNILFYFLLVITLTSGNVLASEKPRQTLPALKSFPAKDFVLNGEDGKTYQLSKYKGKLVLLNFWATWCPPCREEMPAMERAWQKLKDSNIVFLAVNVGETIDQIFPFTASYPVSFPLLMDIKGEVVKQYPVVGLPTTYLVSPNGLVTHRVVGTREWDEPSMIERLKNLSKIK